MANTSRPRLDSEERSAHGWYDIMTPTLQRIAQDGGESSTSPPYPYKVSKDSRVYSYVRRWACQGVPCTVTDVCGSHSGRQNNDGILDSIVVPDEREWCGTRRCTAHDNFPLFLHSSHFGVEQLPESLRYDAGKMMIHVPRTVQGYQILFYS